MVHLTCIDSDGPPLPLPVVCGRQRVRHLSFMSFLTDLTPATPRATSTALLTFACELTKPLSCTTRSKVSTPPVPRSAPIVTPLHRLLLLHSG